jgi:type II secretory pathway pseudopilin PulG
VVPNRKSSVFLFVGLMLPLLLSACRKQEQEVVGVAANAAHSAQQAAAHAEQKAQAAATESAKNRAALEHIPLPTKALYVNVHEPGEWKNPFLTVGGDQIDVRIVMADANPSPVGAGSMMRPEAARRQEIQIRPGDLANALIALPDGAWRYGRVVAIAESPDAARKERPAIRRNMEAAIQKLNDMGIVVEEWPTR